MSKNSPKSKVSGGCSDGACRRVRPVAELGGGGSGGGYQSPEITAFSFPLDKPVLALLGQVLVGQEVEFVREASRALAQVLQARPSGTSPPRTVPGSRPSLRVERTPP